MVLYFLFFQGKLENFKEFDSINLLDLADEHFYIMKDLVDKAVDRFGFKDIPEPPFLGKPGYLRIELKIKSIDFYLSQIVKVTNIG